MPRLRKQSDTSDDTFFAALAAGKTVIDAAKLIECSRQALYRRRITDRAFDRRWRSIEDARKRPSSRLPRRYRRPVFDRPGGYSNGMLLGRLKALRPERYREPSR